jgi:uncharacterized membrane protein HdeD (DUF308 family)
MARTLSRVMGVVFLLVGVAGFAAPGLLGMHLSTTHNVIHLLSGALALYFGFGASPRAARAFCLAFGAVYLGLGLLGLVAPGVVAELVQARHVDATPNMTPDNVVHLLLGAVFLAGGLVRAPGRVVPAA